MTAQSWGAQRSDPCADLPFPCGETISSLDAGRADGWFPDSIAIIGRALLRRVECLYSHYGVDLPDRRVWAAGEVPFDCNQLIVSLESLSEGLVGTESQIPSPCNVPVNATFNVTVVRCFPVDAKGGPTKTDVLAAAADAAARDAYLLMKLSGCLDMYGADTGDMTRLGGMGTEASVAIANAQGGVQAVTLQLTTVVG